MWRIQYVLGHYMGAVTLYYALQAPTVTCNLTPFHFGLKSTLSHMYSNQNKEQPPS